jgi:hypothetical protein
MDAFMSAFGVKWTCRIALHMSAFEGKADMTFCRIPLLLTQSGPVRTIQH